MRTVKIILADDHAMFRDGLKVLLSVNSSYKIVGEACNGREALEKIDALRPDLAILDISMPNMTGIEVAHHVRKYYPAVKIIILSCHDNEEFVDQLIKYGVNGYLLKENTSEYLFKAIEEVLIGNVFLSPSILTKLVVGLSNNKNYIAGKKLDSIFITITPREKEIIKLIVEGKTGTEIAKILRVSENTVKVHRANIMDKLNIHKSVDLVKYAIKTGLIDK
jgi:DNA-binding NarL/FixJ family response regulator